MVLAGALWLNLVAQDMLLAPHVHADLFHSLASTGILALLGAGLHFLGIFLVASVLFSYQKPAITWLNLCTAVTLVVIGSIFIQNGLVFEGAAVLALALAFVWCNWFTPRRDWLVETMKWANLLLGAGVLLLPVIFTSRLAPILSQPTARLIFGVVLVLTGLIGIVFGVVPSLNKIKAGPVLALPWFLWGLLFVNPLHPLNLFLSISLVVGLVAGEYIPWKKLVLLQAADMGGSFMRLIVAGQVIFLGLMVWIISLVENSLPVPDPKMVEIRLVAIASYNALIFIGMVMIASINLSINGLFSSLNADTLIVPSLAEKPAGVWQRLLNNFLEPFNRSQNLLRGHVQTREKYESLRIQHTAAEKRRLAQLNLLNQLNLELESLLDPPVSAQLTANAIFSSVGGSLIAVLKFDPQQDDLVTLATSGPQSNTIPPGYRQKVSLGLIGRAARLRRSQLAADTRLDTDYLQLERQNALSEMVVPLLYHNRLMGLIVIDSPEANVFNESDIRTIETVAVQLVTSWNRSDHDERLTSLIGAGIALTTTLNVEGVIKEIADTAQQTLDSRFVFVALTDKNGGFTRTAHSGNAPTLCSVLNSDPAGNKLIQDVINSQGPFRLRDVRKRYTSTLTGSNDLRNMLAVPIRVRNSSIGAIMSFGRGGNISFSENDESLISLLSNQAAAAIETTWLYQELRSMLSTATQLYALSTRVVQSEQLADSAAAIAETAYQLSKAEAAGIVLTAFGKDTQTRVQIDRDGLHTGAQHPMNLIEQALESGQTITINGENQIAQVCIPLQTLRHQYGALWVRVPEQYWANSHDSDNLHTLANQAAIALERSLLIMETRKQSLEIEAAYHELETTYDQTLGALSSALDARDRETEGHSLRVSRIAYQLGLRLGLSLEQAKTLERGSILHDIGKIGISDTILLKPGPLSEQEWQLMRMHPDIGARIIEGIPFLETALPAIRYHQERWNGSGYPDGLKGEEIPLMARIFAVVDVFDALTNDRPYRKRSPVNQSMAFLKENAGILFDPEIVAEFEKMINDGLLASLV